jgi:hypothetical protein
MTAKADRIAILLRGPQCTGKTSAAQELLGGQKPIDLDTAANTAYRDLQCTQDVLVLELGAAEEPTRNPRAWQTVLEKEGLSLFAFYTIAERLIREARARTPESIKRGVNMDSLNASDEIHREPYMIAFAQVAGISETQVDTSHKTQNEVAHEIRAVVAKTHPNVNWPTRQLPQ